jgi:hypothetical protein
MNQSGRHASDACKLLRLLLLLLLLQKHTKVKYTQLR